MALAFSNATVTHGSASVSVVTNLHTAVADSVLLIVTSVAEPTSLSSVIAGGAACTRLAYVAFDTNQWNIELWKLDNPGSGTLTISAHMPGAASALFGLAALTFTGQVQAAPTGDAAIFSAPGVNTLSVSASSSANTLMVSVFGHFTTLSTIVFADGTERAKFSVSGISSVIVGTKAGSSGAQTMIASSTAASAWGGITINIIESAGAAGSVWKFTLGQMGVGR